MEQKAAEIQRTALNDLQEGLRAIPEDNKKPKCLNKTLIFYFLSKIQRNDGGKAQDFFTILSKEPAILKF